MPEIKYNEANRDDLKGVRNALGGNPYMLKLLELFELSLHSESPLLVTEPINREVAGHPRLTRLLVGGNWGQAVRLGIEHIATEGPQPLIGGVPGVQEVRSSRRGVMELFSLPGGSNQEIDQIIRGFAERPEVTGQIAARIVAADGVLVDGSRVGGFSLMPYYEMVIPSPNNRRWGRGRLDLEALPGYFKWESSRIRDIAKHRTTSPIGDFPVFPSAGYTYPHPMNSPS